MIRVKGLQHVSQVNDYFCGPAAVECVLLQKGIKVSQGELAIKLNTTEDDGTSPEAIVRVLEEYKIIPLCIENADIWALQYAVRQDRPVIVAYQEWEDGHYAVVMGYDKNHLYLQDPGFETIACYEYFDFLSRWHDTGADGRKYEHLAIVV